MTVYGYVPERITVLRTRALEAIDALDTISSVDPAAADALRSVRLMRNNLYDTLLPLVEAIHSSTAMVTWRSAVGRTWPFDPGDWISTNGLDDLTDAAVILRLSLALDVFRRAVDGDGSMDIAHPRLVAMLDECARRATVDDGSFARMLWRRLGPTGFERLLDRVDSAVELASAALIGDGAPDAVTKVAGPAARLLAVLTRVEPGAQDLLVERVTRSPHALDTVLHEVGAFDAGVVRELTREMLAYTAGVAHWADRPRVHDSSVAAGRLLAALAAFPQDARVLLSEPLYLRVVATSRSFADADVESVVAAALGVVDGSDRAGTADGLRILAELARITSGDELNDGGRRGVALGLGPYLPTITPQLDTRTTMYVPVDRDVSVELGSYQALARLMGQVIDDELAQLALGAVVGGFREAQYQSFVTVMGGRADGDRSDSGEQLAGALADVTRFVWLIDDARTARDELLAFRHGLAMSHTLGLLSTVTTATTTVFPPSRVVARLGSVAVAQALETAGSSTARSVPSTGIEGDLAAHFTWALLGLPLQHPELRARLGLSRVPAGTWRELDRLSTALDETADLDERAELHARMRAVISNDTDLDGFYESASVLSGEATLRRQDATSNTGDG